MYLLDFIAAASPFADFVDALLRSVVGGATGSALPATGSCSGPIGVPGGCG